MADNSQIQQRDQKIAELETDLALAHRLIKQQQQQIIQLQQQIVPTNNQYQQQSTFFHSNISGLQETQSNERPVTEKTQHQRTKMRLIRKKHSGQLSSLQYASIVTGVVLIITVSGLALTRRQNPPSTKQVTTPSQKVSTNTNTLTPPPVLSSVPVETSPITLPQVRQENLQLAYNITTDPNFKKSQELQTIVDDVVALAAAKKLPIKPLSITLINAKTGKFAAYKQEERRYPASVVKMFWMVYLYAQIQNGFWNEAAFTPYLNKMIKNSDNDSASYILDAITRTESGQNLKGEEYENWLKNRKTVNEYFQQADYKKINISQKVFPINYLKISEPKGSDLKMRGNPEKPIRNKITTQQAARLLYEIFDGQAVSLTYSQKMAELLEIDSQTRIDKKDDQNPNEFNPVRGYLSESLPTNVYFGGKAGWTSSTRQEAAYISTPDGKAAYILVVFAEDRAYAYDWKIFPQISRLVFDRMTNSK